MYNTVYHTALTLKGLSCCRMDRVIFKGQKTELRNSFVHQTENWTPFSALSVLRPSSSRPPSCENFTLIHLLNWQQIFLNLKPLLRWTTVILSQSRFILYQKNDVHILSHFLILGKKNYSKIHKCLIWLSQWVIFRFITK